MSANPRPVRLRPTVEADIEFVRSLEAREQNRPFIGRWTSEQHAAAIADRTSEHWIIEDAASGERLGFAIAFDGRDEGRGVYLKRIATAAPARGIGRAALIQFLQHAFGELGADEVSLSVRAGNSVARALYDSLGFAASAEPRDGSQRLRLAAADFAARR